MMRRTVLLTLILLLAASGAAHAEPGQLEINQACVATGCFPGDAPGFPVTITTPGAYRLTSNLSQTLILGVTSTSDMVVIEATGVSLDLGGFAIRCVEAFTTPGTACSGSFSDGDGIRAAFVGGGIQGVVVSNGSVYGMPGDGIDLEAVATSEVRDVQVFGNGSSGISIGGVSLVSRAKVHDNGSLGITAGPASVVRDSLVFRHAIGGIRIEDGGQVLDSNVVDNGEIGIRLGDGALARGNTVRDHLVAGIVQNDGLFGSRGIAQANILSDNGLDIYPDGGSSGVVDGGDNVCLSAPTGCAP